MAKSKVSVERGMKDEGAPEELCRAISNARFARRGFSHPAVFKHPKCWACGRDMGCFSCSGPPRELLCMGDDAQPHDKRHDGRGPVWASKAALLEHGPLTMNGQLVGDYPESWASEYLQQPEVGSNGAR